MKIYDISQEIYTCKVFPGDPAPQREVLAKIADGNVTLAKLGADVTPTLTQVETNKTDIADLKTKVGDGMVAISEDEINALFSV